MTTDETPIPRHLLDNLADALGALKEAGVYYTTLLSTPVPIPKERQENGQGFMTLSLDHMPSRSTHMNHIRKLYVNTMNRLLGEIHEHKNNPNPPDDVKELMALILSILANDDSATLQAMLKIMEANDHHLTLPSTEVDNTTLRIFSEFVDSIVENNKREFYDLAPEQDSFYLKLIDELSDKLTDKRATTLNVVHNLETDAVLISGNNMEFHSMINLVENLLHLLKAKRSSMEQERTNKASKENRPNLELV